MGKKGKAKPRKIIEWFGIARSVGVKIQGSLVRQHLPHDTRVDLELAEIQILALLNDMKQEAKV